MLDLFADDEPWQEPLAPGAVILRRFARLHSPQLMAAIHDVAARSPFRHMVTPGGYTMFDIGAAWNVTKNVKLRSGVLNVGDKDLSRDDYSYTEEGRRYFMAVDYRF